MKRTRAVVSKTFEEGTKTETMLMNGRPIYASIVSKFGSVEDEDYDVNLVEGLPNDISLHAKANAAKKCVVQNPVLKSAMLSVDGNSVIPLRQQFGFVAGESFNRYDLNSQLSADEYKGRTVWDELNDPMVETNLRQAANEMYGETNPLTGSTDVTGDEFFAPYIPMVALTGVVPSQLDEDGNAFFNPEGIVTIAEFIDTLNAAKTSSNAREGRRLSLDNVSKESDFFNAGYNACVTGLTSPFYKLYTRKEILTQPITRLELAYITVVCWHEYVAQCGNILGGKYSCGINTNWDTPARYLRKFSDGLEYKVYKKCRALGSGENVARFTSYHLKDYCGEMSMTEFKTAMQSGARGIPLPMIMCMAELDALDLFYFEGARLDPLREVSRGELAYFIVRLAKTFPMKFISSGDNSYMR